MVGMGFGSILNIFGDWILVPKIGMHGAGLATMTSQIVSFVLLRIGINKSSCVKIHIKNYKFSKELYLALVRYEKMHGAIYEAYLSGSGYHHMYKASQSAVH